MKFNLEIEIEWLYEDSTLDQEIEDRLITTLSDKINTEFSKGIGNTIAKSAERLVTAKTEMLINTALEQPVTIQNGWNNETKYNSILDMVEHEITALYDTKLTSNGLCKEDPLLANIKNYVKSSFNEILKKAEKQAINIATKAAKDEASNSDLLKTLTKVLESQENSK